MCTLYTHCIFAIYTSRTGYDQIISFRTCHMICFMFNLFALLFHVFFSSNFICYSTKHFRFSLAPIINWLVDKAISFQLSKSVKKHHSYGSIVPKQLPKWTQKKYKKIDWLIFCWRFFRVLSFAISWVFVYNS